MTFQSLAPFTIFGKPQIEIVKCEIVEVHPRHYSSPRYVTRYAASDSLLAIAFAISFFLAPAASNARTKRSSETAGSLASILATRDWLERRRFARSLCERPCCCRRSFKLALKVSLSSTKAASSGVNPRKSFADPTFHPAFSRRFLLAGFM